MKENNYLISVTCDGKVVELYYSEALGEVNTIRAIHPGCDIEAVQLKLPTAECPEYVGDTKKRGLSRNGKPWANKVTCLETGEVWSSVVECSNATGIPSWAIYKSVHKGYNAFGRHFNLLPPDQKRD